VKTVLRRISHQEDQKVIHHHDLQIDPSRFRVSRTGVDVSLTPKEFRLLLTLAQHPGQVLSRATLAEKAFGYHYEGLERTVDTHIFNIRRKLEPIPSDPQYILTVFGVGYRFAEVI